MDRESVDVSRSSRDERWLLSAPRSIPSAKRASSPISQAYAEMVEKERGMDDVPRRKHLSQSSAHGMPISKSRAAYLDDSQQYVRNASASRDMGQKESPIIGELKTNVIIKDEFTLVTDLSYHLATRYNRPESCVMIKVDHSACLALGGAFDPCYILTVSALPYQLSSTSNRRNAAIIQTFMADILSVPPDRGIVKFQLVEESCLAMNGLTMLGETERNEKRLYGGDGTSLAVKRAITHVNRKSMSGTRRGGMRVDSLPNDRDHTQSPNGILKNPLSPTERADLQYKRRSIPEEPEPPSPRRHQPMPDVYELPATEAPVMGDDAVPDSVIDDLTGTYVADSASRTEDARLGTPNRNNARRQSRITQHLDDDPMDSESSRRSMARLSQAISSASNERLSAVKRYSQGLRPEQKSLLSQAIPPNIGGGNVSRTDVDDFSTNKKVSASRNNFTSSTTTTITRPVSPPDDPVPDAKLDARAAEKYSRETGANVARRRSMITATPNLPAPTPPSIPERKTSVMPEPKGLLAKRKSFLSAFRRGTTVSSH